MDNQSIDRKIKTTKREIKMDETIKMYETIKMDEIKEDELISLCRYENPIHCFEMDYIDVGMEQSQRVYSCNSCGLIITIDQWLNYLKTVVIDDTDGDEVTELDKVITSVSSYDAWLESWNK